MKKIKQILWDTDTQNDFIMPDGTLSVPGAYGMIENFGKAIYHFQNKGIPVLGSVDAHTGPELISGTKDQYFPLHCIKGTKGQQKITSTQGDILYVSDNKYTDNALDLVVNEVMDGRRVYVEKQGLSLLSNPNIIDLIEKLGVEEVYLMGVATNICVKEAFDAFKDMQKKVYLIHSAIKGLDIPGSTEKQGLEYMLKSGAEMYRF
ncbi:MAG: cysteine hydrolase family protein [Nanoarchaeota archaeon]|nr:cysteine hydrolase family protein [Nanoarchaeota archaeon]